MQCQNCHLVQKMDKWNKKKKLELVSNENECLWMWPERCRPKPPPRWSVSMKHPQYLRGPATGPGSTASLGTLRRPSSQGMAAAPHTAERRRQQGLGNTRFPVCTSWICEWAAQQSIFRTPWLKKWRCHLWGGASFGSQGASSAVLSPQFPFCQSGRKAESRADASTPKSFISSSTRASRDPANLLGHLGSHPWLLRSYLLRL